MAWKQYILQKKQISTDAGLTWADAEPYTTRVGDPVATFDSYEECMNMLYRWIPSEIEYCDYQVNANSKAVFSVTPNLYVKPEEEELRKFAVYRYGLDKNGDDDVYITLEETSQFDKRELTDATFFEGVKEIENGAFNGFTNLSAVTLSSTITSIGDNAFQNCSGITNLIMSDRLVSIGDSAFKNCSKITNINIPNSVITIGGYAFGGCTGLTSTTIGNNVTNIGYGSFRNCSRLTNVSIGNRVTSIGPEAFYNCGFSNIDIPDSVTSIGNWAFVGGSDLDFITIGSGITYIGLRAFASRELGDVTIKALNPPILGGDENNRSFGNLTDRLKFFVPAESLELYRNEDEWSYYKDKIRPIPSICSAITYTATEKLNVDFSSFTPTATAETFSNGVGRIEFTKTVNYINDWAFEGCTGLTSINIPDSITTIDQGAFAGCTALTSATIGQYVAEIDLNAFNGCSGLTSINLPNYLQNIGWYAFDGCSGLTNVIIPDSVKTIGKYAFSNSNLEDVIIGSGITSIGENAFRNNNLGDVTILALKPPTLSGNEYNRPFIQNSENLRFFVPAGSVDLYKAQWTDYADKIYPIIE